ncbi:MAG: sec-independent protein translocase protein TatB [Acidimicrobiaceae bacterium]|nr:sec-independent protein translocase protein TatB [Acidimicrobiaceae bacterium]
MLNFPGPEKILLLAVIALVVIGPTRLPQAARTAGKWIAELRKLTSRFQEEVSGALAEPKDALTAAVGDLRSEVGGWREELGGLSRAITTAPAAAAATMPSSVMPPSEVATWTNAATYGSLSSTSNSSTDSVSSGPALPGLPSLPPAPDDPSLN